MLTISSSGSAAAVLVASNRTTAVAINVSCDRLLEFTRLPRIDRERTNTCSMLPVLGVADQLVSFSGGFLRLQPAVVACCQADATLRVGYRFERKPEPERLSAAEEAWLQIPRGRC